MRIKIALSNRLGFSKPCVTYWSAYELSALRVKILSPLETCQNQRACQEKRVMKVLCFANTSWYLWNFRKKFLEDAVARGHEVIVLAPDSDYQKKFEILGCQFHLVSLLPNQTNIVRELAALRRIIYLYRSLQPQIAFHFTIKPVIYGSIACWISNVKAINTITGLGNLFLRKRLLTIVESA